MDASMSNARDLVFQAGTHENAIRLKFHDWFALVNPRVEFFAVPEHASSDAGLEDREDVGTERSGRAAKPRPEGPMRESGQPGGGRGRIDVVEHS